MCRWFITCCFCFVFLLSQQQCLSAALRPAELDSEAEDGEVALDGVVLEEDLQRVRGRDSNITRLRHHGSKRERRLQRRLESLEEDIQWMKEQLLELKRYVSKHQTSEYSFVAVVVICLLVVGWLLIVLLGGFFCCCYVLAVFWFVYLLVCLLLVCWRGRFCC